jgi:hypothetical protein
VFNCCVPTALAPRSFIEASIFTCRLFAFACAAVFAVVAYVDARCRAAKVFVFISSCRVTWSASRLLEASLVPAAESLACADKAHRVLLYGLELG